MKTTNLITIALVALLVVVGVYFYYTRAKTNEVTGGDNTKSPPLDLGGLQCVTRTVGQREWDERWLQHNWTFDQAILEIHGFGNVTLLPEQQKSALVSKTLGWFKLANISPTPALVAKFKSNIKAYFASGNETEFWNIPKSQIGALNCVIGSEDSDSPQGFAARLLGQIYTTNIFNGYN